MLSKKIAICFAVLLGCGGLAFLVWSRGDVVRRAFYLRTDRSAAAKYSALYTAGEVEEVLRKCGAERGWVSNVLYGVNFEKAYVLITPEKSVTSVRRSLGARVVRLAAVRTNGVGVTVVEGRNNEFIKFADLP